MKTPIAIHVLTLLATPAFAQLVPDGGTAIIDGVTNTLPGSLTIGTNVGNTTLILTNGGQVNSDGGAIGSGASSRSNVVFITGPGSTWNNYSNTIVRLGNSGAGNQLIVTNGGRIVGSVRFGSNATSSNNSMVVTGPGAEVLAIDLDMSANGARNQLTIENDARVSAGEVRLGSDTGPLSSNNTLRVTGGGLLLITNHLEIGGFSRNNQLIIDNAGKVTNDSCVIGLGNTSGLSASNTVTVTGTGSVWHCRTGLVVGVLGRANQVVISDSGMLRTDKGFYIGSSSNGNSIVVSGADSLWSVGLISLDTYVGGAGSDNQVIVTNGGLMRTESNESITIGATSGSNNVVRVTGPGSRLVTTNGGSPINVGGVQSAVATRSRLVVENGGQAFIRSITIGPGGSSSNHEVSVSGPGSLLSAAGSFRVAFLSSGNHLSISNGGMVVAQAQLFVGNNPSATGQLTVSDASLIVTNTAGNNLFDVNRGTNLFHGGTILTDRLRVTNGGNSVFQFFRGTLKSANTVINSGSAFVVGDGTGGAVFQLPGGTHAFNQGLVISSNAALQGCGTVAGAVTVQPGGTVLSDCTNLVFTGTVTNHGTLRALNGSTLRAQGLVVNQGAIDIIEGTTNFLGGFINNGIVLTSADVRISEVNVSGNDVVVKLPSFVGHNFQLQRRDSLATGLWTNVGAAEAGTGGILTFTDTGSMTNAPERFYRIRLVP